MHFEPDWMNLSEWKGYSPRRRSMCPILCRFPVARNPSSFSLVPRTGSTGPPSGLHRTDRTFPLGSCKGPRNPCTDTSPRTNPADCSFCLSLSCLLFLNHFSSISLATDFLSLFFQKNSAILKIVFRQVEIPRSFVSIVNRQKFHFFLWCFSQRSNWQGSFLFYQINLTLPCWR